MARFLRDGEQVYKRETSGFNAETRFSFLWQLWAAGSRSNPRVVVITDNVRHHHAAPHRVWREVAEPKFKLEFLPPHSPDLSPIERV